jgi:hypothetical protein
MFLGSKRILRVDILKSILGCGRILEENIWNPSPITQIVFPLKMLSTTPHFLRKESHAKAPFNDATKHAALQGEF